MKAKVKSINVETFKTKDGKKEFKKAVYVCDVTINEATGEVKTLKGNASVEYFKKYLQYCNVQAKELPGKLVDVVVSKRAYTNDKGEERIYSQIKYLNILNEEGKPIIMPNENEVGKLDDLAF